MAEVVIATTPCYMLFDSAIVFPQIAVLLTIAVLLFLSLIAYMIFARDQVIDYLFVCFLCMCYLFVCFLCVRVFLVTSGTQGRLLLHASLC